jgi:hypothetical protein
MRQRRSARVSGLGTACAGTAHQMNFQRIGYLAKRYTIISRVFNASMGQPKARACAGCSRHHGSRGGTGHVRRGVEPTPDRRMASVR